MNKPKKPLYKRLLIFCLLFGLLLAIVLGTATTPFEKLTVKQLVLKEDPRFVIEREAGSKNNGVEYKILLSFNQFKDTLHITGNDLEFANRKAIQQELKAGDRVTVTYHDVFLYVCQLSKNGKNYMNAQQAFKSGRSIELFLLWLSIVGSVTCLAGFIFVKRNVKHAGWLCAAIILVAGVILFFAFGVHFSNTGNYTEFTS
ncbi:MAG TPA: hypothetical protein VK177_04410 [Flavobacteriales bacterium]|nr:hypothetical protein [Flavobacteriales bacterium]